MELYGMEIVLDYYHGDLHVIYNLMERMILQY